MAQSFTQQFRVPPDGKIRIGDIDPADTRLADGKKQAKAAHAADLVAIRELQYALYAEGKQGLLICLQAPDAAGKDGTIRRLSPALNPQGCHVVSFKVPTEIERDHDFLWRIHPHAPRRGGISIFNRSHYEDVLVVRVKDLAPEPVWQARFDHINNFEKLLFDNGTRILKFYLCISPQEQLERFEKRLDDPAKNWKISVADYTERDFWDAYVSAYEDVFSRCSPDHAPWFIIPADKKWYRDFVIARIIREQLEAMAMKIPEPSVDLADIRRRYFAEVQESEA
ncbi:polyphosphate kinase 2 family protein [Acuticoccus sp. MNP-M23]|uniref:PPK2 family polyphosphate kinase n=1 Tax=Acuticoccus sp. MNP-M23 TaxID=3072793 RepID=UPI002815A6A5|nr:PPK2 family polyphosphate kinase [Acuticoccus sp. MNP-M23]WMS42801.1 polyphosphate kinase 2 family protein [Acuticoccus sp. MNP-M23]